MLWFPRTLVDDRHGAIAVEAAVTISGLAMFVLMLADFYLIQSSSLRMDDSLRFAAQHVINGGRDLDRVEDIFEQSYGGESVQLSHELICSCPVTVTSQGEIGDDTTAQDVYAGADRLEINDTNDGWPSCTNSCSDNRDVQSYLSISAADTLDTLLLPTNVDIDGEFLVHIIQ